MESNNKEENDDLEFEAYCNKLKYCSCKKCGYINQVISYHYSNYNCKRCGNLLDNSLSYKSIYIENIYLGDSFNTGKSYHKFYTNTIISLLFEIKK